MDKIYYLDENLRKNNTAGAKAPDDIAAICKALGFETVTMPMLKHTYNKKIKNFEIIFKYLTFWIILFLRLRKNTIVIYQHPTLGKRMTAKLLPLLMKWKHLRFIAVIHDLESLRGGLSGAFAVDEHYAEEELRVLNACECIISHNARMSAFLESKEISGEKLINLELFDYLSDSQTKRAEEPSADFCIAGNLAKGKCSYIYDMFSDGHNSRINVNLYGNNYEEGTIGNLHYCGSFKPDILPEILDGRFGLVWDGNSAETCTGNTGEYLRYNNPHKTSLYLCAGIPVIVWKEAAIAEFIRLNDAGICIDSLMDLQNVFAGISVERYAELRENAGKVQRRVRDGYYFTRAIKQAISLMKCSDTD